MKGAVLSLCLLLFCNRVVNNPADGKLKCRSFKRAPEGLIRQSQRQYVLTPFLVRICEIPFTQQNNILHNISAAISINGLVYWRLKLMIAVEGDFNQLHTVSTFIRLLK